MHSFKMYSSISFLHCGFSISTDYLLKREGEMVSKKMMTIFFITPECIPFQINVYNIYSL